MAYQHVRPLAPERLMVFRKNDMPAFQRQQLPTTLVPRDGSQPIPRRLERRRLVTTPGILHAPCTSAAQSRDVDAAHVDDVAVQAALRLIQIGPLLGRVVVVVAMNPEHRATIDDDGFQNLMQRTVQLAVAQEHNCKGRLAGILVEKGLPAAVRVTIENDAASVGHEHLGNGGYRR